MIEHQAAVNLVLTGATRWEGLLLVVGLEVSEETLRNNLVEVLCIGDLLI